MLEFFFSIYYLLICTETIVGDNWSFLFIVFSALSTPTNQQTSLFSFLAETLIILTTTSNGLGSISFEVIYITNTQLSFCNSFESDKRKKICSGY